MRNHADLGRFNLWRPMVVARIRGSKGPSALPTGSKGPSALPTVTLAKHYPRAFRPGRILRL